MITNKRELMNWNNINFDEDMFYLTSREECLNDPEYRYRIAKPILQVIGKKGNNTTLFKNSEYYADRLGIPSIIFSKYIGYKLSCPTMIDKGENNCTGWKGVHLEETIIEYLKEFIQSFILCPTCDYPEIDLSLNEKKNIQMNCRSCGTNCQIQIANRNKNWFKTYEQIVEYLKTK